MQKMKDHGADLSSIDFSLLAEPEQKKARVIDEATQMQASKFKKTRKL